MSKTIADDVAEGSNVVMIWTLNDANSSDILYLRG